MAETEDPKFKGRQIRMKSVMSGDKELFFQGMEVHEELGRMFRIQLQCVSNSFEIELKDLLGTEITIEIDLDTGKPGYEPGKGKKRFYHGYVTQFAFTGKRWGFGAYDAVIHPGLWFLTKTNDCKIFQNKTAVDIVKDVIKENCGTMEVSDRLSGSYETRNYCVQYRESDFNFVSRLMEQEGMYYYFVHEEDKHKMVLSDAKSSHDACPDHGEIKFFEEESEYRRTEDHIFDWRLTQAVQTGKVVLDDYVFQSSTADLKQEKSLPGEQSSFKDLELFDYPGYYEEDVVGDKYQKVGEQFTDVRMEEHRARYSIARAMCNVRTLLTGCSFKLKPGEGDEILGRKDQAKEYLVIRARHNLQIEVEDEGAGGGDSAGGDISDSLKIEFEAIEAATQFRPLRVTPKPHMKGPQTAEVCGKSNEEIYTDEYGRVKVQFHWDRYGGEGRKDDLLDPCRSDLGRQELGRHVHSAHRPGGDRRLPGGRPRPADHHRQGLQRPADRALRTGWREDEVDHQERQQQG